MIVIDGWQGKSRKLVEILKEKNTSPKDTLIIDTEQILGLGCYGEHYLCGKSALTEKSLIELIAIRLFKNPDIRYIVLEFNTSRKNLNLFKRLEQEFNKEVIITIQCPAEESQKEIKVYEV